MDVRLFYVDDSGSPESRLVVFGWVELLAVDWSSALRVWLDWRRHLHTTVGIPASYELHATKFGSGRGRPSGTDWDLHKANRATTMVSALTTIAALPGVATGAVYRPIVPYRHYYDTKTALYAELINRLDQRLARNGELGMVLMDGDGTDPMYRTTHRGLKLATRRIIEDPWFQGAHLSQWIQVADFVAYTAFATLHRPPARRVMWEWYPTLLGAGSITGATPQQI
jgi:Protein of unknown function (DUF3800)